MILNLQAGRLQMIPPDVTHREPPEPWQTTCCKHAHVDSRGQLPSVARVDAFTGHDVRLHSSMPCFTINTFGLLAYLQCWCAWYSRPPPPEFPAVACGSPRYPLPWGAAAGCGGLDLGIFRYGPQPLRYPRPSSSFRLGGSFRYFTLFPFKHAAPLTATYPENAQRENRAQV